MEIPRSARIIGIVGLFVGFVAWIVPPTTPAPAGRAVEGGGGRPNPSRPPADAAGRERDDRPAAAEIAPADPSSRGESDHDADGQAWRGAPAEAESRASDDRVAADDRGESAGDYRSGYRWAEREGVQSPRECREQPTAAAEAGCRRYLADDRDSGDYSQDDAEREAR